MVDYKKGSHTIYDIKYHVVWVTKYRYKVLHKAIGERLRELLRQGCETIGVTIVQGRNGLRFINVLTSGLNNISLMYIKHIKILVYEMDMPPIEDLRNRL